MNNVTPSITTEQIMTLMLTSIIILTLVVLGMTYIIYLLVKKKKEVPEEAESTAAVSPESEKTKPALLSWGNIRHKLTAAVPISEERSIDMGHNYDGIRELDNNLPPWWKYSFYLTIIFAVVYMFIYHVNSDWSSDQEYQAEMAEADLIKEQYLEQVVNQVNEQTVTALEDESSLSAGKQIFITYCVACHGNEGQGNAVGPNLTDQYWLHGGGIKDIFRTIKYGVPEKGMIPWQTQLKPEEMHQVSSFILSLVGTNPPDPKAPQGDLYVPEEESPEAADSAANPVAVR